MDKIEIGNKLPEYFKSLYPEEFQLFSHLETTAAVPQVLFAITTWKENSKPNVCFHSWSCFHGDKTAFYAVMGCLYQHTHTYANIKRDKCFCINFLPVNCYDRLVDTINNNNFETDEFKAGGFTLKKCRHINAPYIDEAFISMELSLVDMRDLSGAGITAMVTGKVENIMVEKSYALDREKRCSKDGFMLLVPSVQNLITGEPSQSAIATLNIDRLD